MDPLLFDKDQDYTREAEILKVLGHPIRLKIIAGLTSQSCNVKNLGMPRVATGHRFTASGSA